MRWGQWDDRLHRSTWLFVVSAVLVGVGVAAVTWLSRGAPNRLSLSEIGVLVAAGLIGAVVLGAAYRWRRGREQWRFTELFGAAARQLGDADVAVRLAGVYAMAGVADEFAAPSRRQQCVDALCGYLRLPFDSATGSNHLVARGETTDESGTGIERIYKFRQNDAEVRRTIVTVLAQRLRRSAAISWSRCDVVLDGAVVEHADFRDTIFAGRRASFDGVVFSGPTTFEYSVLTAARVTFRGATFEGGPARFDHARFDSGRAVRDERAESGTSFEDATFEGPASFEHTTFAGARSSFEGVRWTGPRTTFRSAAFGSEVSSFARATVEGEELDFSDVEMASPRISFAGTKFSASTVTVDGSRLGAVVRSRNRGTHDTDFREAEFHGTVTFADTRFAGRVVDFGAVDFLGDISFLGTDFAATEVRFEQPKAWVGVRVDWDEQPTEKPSCVTPETWPPTAK